MDEPLTSSYISAISYRREISLTRAPMIYEEETRFLYGEQYQHLLIPFPALDSPSNLPHVPGIYAWFIKCRPAQRKEMVPLFAEMLSQANVQATMKGTLRFEYSGELQKKHSKTPPDLSCLFSDALVAFPYPLYIGMSMQLSKRLYAHRRQLESWLSTYDDDGLRSQGDSGEPGFSRDSEAESKYFGQRLAAFWYQQGRRTIDELYVRCVVPVECRERPHCQENCDPSCKDARRKELLAIERFLNTTFNPVFGRR